VTLALAFVGVFALVLVVPHRLDLDRAPPLLAATVWAASLSLRALSSIFAAVFVVFYLPPTAVFSIVTHWCWHTVLPVITEHLPVNGHSIGDLALIAPGFFLVVSLVSVSFGLWRGARQVHHLIQRGTIGDGPGDSVVLADGGVVVAAAGIRRPRVVISAGALVAFDDQELAASLDHERGHIAHQHRFVLLAAAVCSSLGRMLPGTRRASAELAYHLERDADAFALGREAAPTALASAICKAACAQLAGLPITALGGGSVSRRVNHLLDQAEPLSRRRLVATQALAGLLVTLSLATAAVLPAGAAASIHVSQTAAPTHACQR
jgi:Zn-dependent protease with chaperone function